MTITIPVLYFVLPVICVLIYWLMCEWHAHFFIATHSSPFDVFLQIDGQTFLKNDPLFTTTEFIWSMTPSRMARAVAYRAEKIAQRKSRIPLND